VSVTPSPSATSVASIIITNQSLVLATIALISIIIALSIVFWFGRRITIQTHLRNTLFNAAVSLESEKGIRDLTDKAWSSPLSNSNRFPEEAQDINLRHDLWLADPNTKSTALFLQDEPKFMTKDQFLDYNNIQPGPDAGKKYQEFQDQYQCDKANYDKRKLGIAKFREWEERERQIYNQMKDDIISKATQDTQKTLPKSMDVSILGTGFSFLLEFSTVIVIIFAVIVMGVLGVLTGAEIAPILAAIAGYVLGKGTYKQSTQEGQQAAATPSTTATPTSKSTTTTQ